MWISTFGLSWYPTFSGLKDSSTLKMEGACPPETSVFIWTIPVVQTRKIRCVMLTVLTAAIRSCCLKNLRAFQYWYLGVLCVDQPRLSCHKETFFVHSGKRAAHARYFHVELLVSCATAWTAPRKIFRLLMAFRILVQFPTARLGLYCSGSKSTLIPTS
jgi:hypothetical protein